MALVSLSSESVDNRHRSFLLYPVHRRRRRINGGGGRPGDWQLELQPPHRAAEFLNVRMRLTSVWSVAPAGLLPPCLPAGGSLRWLVPTVPAAVETVPR